MEETTIPAMPEITLTGMKAQFSPRILQCSKGGFVVIFDGHGISGVSTYEEAINRIMQVGAEVLGEETEPDIPRILRRQVQDIEEPAPKKEVNIGRILHVAIATVATCLVAIGIRVT